MDDSFKISEKRFKSRLIVGTGKYKNFLECSKAIKASGAQIVTVAVRRVNISDKKKPLLMDYIDPKKITYLPNTAKVLHQMMLRIDYQKIEDGIIKLEVLVIKTYFRYDKNFKSTEILTKEGFKVMVYCPMIL